MQDLYWRRWLTTFVVLGFGGTALLYLAVVLLDPFATGRLTPFTHFRVTTDLRNFAHAGRLRNPEFDSAIIGNSRGFGLEPSRIGRRTGRHFVHLTMAALFPADQLKVMRLFQRHRKGRTPLIVLVVDHETWCSPSRDGTPYALPWWLVEGPDLEYLQRILTADSVRATFRAAGIALGIVGDFSRRDGYELWIPKNTQRLRHEMTLSKPPSVAAPADAAFPYLDDLAQALSELEPDSSVFLFMPPVFSGALPVAGSGAEARANACKRTLEGIAGRRSDTAFVDARIDSPATRDPMNFIDASHYLDPVAIEAEADLVAAITRLTRHSDRR